MRADISQYMPPCTESVQATHGWSHEHFCRTENAKVCLCSISSRGSRRAHAQVHLSQRGACQQREPLDCIVHATHLDWFIVYTLTVAAEAVQLCGRYCSLGLCSCSRRRRGAWRLTRTSSGRRSARAASSWRCARSRRGCRRHETTCARGCLARQTTRGVARRGRTATAARAARRGAQRTRARAR